LNNVPKPKSVGVYDFRTAFPAFSTIYGLLDERKVTGNAARNMVKEFLESVDADAQMLFTKIIKKDLKAGIAEKTLNKAFGDGFVNIYEVQLGQPYDPEKKYKADKKLLLNHWFASPKLNGIRGYQEGDDDLRTRNGNKIFGFDHILEEIKDLKSRYGLFFVDGELFDFDIPFQTITSYVLADVNIIPEHKEKIKFHVFAVGDKTELTNTAAMVGKLRKIDWSKYKYLVEVPYEIVVNDSDIIFLKMNIAYEDGHEGLMLRHPYRCYSKGRSHDILKVKPVKEGDFEIIGFEVGKPDGENANSLGALIIKGNYTMTVNGNDVVYPIRCNCGSGFKKIPGKGVTRDEIYNNQDDWLGAIVEIHFQSITDKPDPKTGCFALQFPRFYRGRDDKAL